MAALPTVAQRNHPPQIKSKYTTCETGYRKTRCTAPHGHLVGTQRGYKGIITIDGNNKDSIEDVPNFIEKLKEGYDLIQGSRFIDGGKAINTPIIRTISVKLIHAPIISLTAHQRFTDTTNAYRAYSAAYLQDDRVKPLRDIFMSYELLAYLSVRATQLGYKACEIPVTRSYPKNKKHLQKLVFLKVIVN